jgi:membrane dipeptidase
VIQVVGFGQYLKPLGKPVLDKLDALRARFDLQPLQGLANALMPGDAIIAIWPESRFGEYAVRCTASSKKNPRPPSSSTSMPSTTR